MAKRKEQFVWVLRHAKASAMDPNAGYRADIARALSDEGVAQAEARKGDFGEFQFVAAAASPATRTRQTASIIAGIPVSMVDPLPALLAPDSAGLDTWTLLGGSKKKADARHINFLFDKMGYAPLAGYRVDPDDLVVMDRYGHETWAKVRPYLRQKGEGHILLVGHAILLAQTMLSAVQEKARHRDRADMRDKLVNAVMGEASGFMIQFVNNKPMGIYVLPEPGQGTGVPESVFAEPPGDDANNDSATEIEEVEEQALPPAPPPPPPPAEPPASPPPPPPPPQGDDEEK